MPRPSTPLLHPRKTITSQHAVSGGWEKRTGLPSQAQRQSHLAGDLVFLVLGLGLGFLEEEDGDKDVDDDDAEQNPVVVLAGVLLVKDRAGNDLRVDKPQDSSGETAFAQEKLFGALAPREKKEIAEIRLHRASCRATNNFASTRQYCFGSPWWCGPGVITNRT